MKHKRCPPGGVALVEHLRKQWLNAGGGSRVDGPKAPKRFVCSRAIADSIGAELLQLQLYPDGRAEQGEAPRRRSRGAPFLRDGDTIQGMRVELLDSRDPSSAGLAWIS